MCVPEVRPYELYWWQLPCKHSYLSPPEDSFFYTHQTLRSMNWTVLVFFFIFLAVCIEDFNNMFLAGPPRTAK